MASSKHPTPSPALRPESPIGKSVRLRHHAMMGHPPSGPIFPQLSESERKKLREQWKQPTPGWQH